jgi:hypothetical protein
MHLLQRYLSDFLNLTFPTEGEPEYLWPWKELLPSLIGLVFLVTMMFIVF